MTFEALEIALNNGNEGEDFSQTWFDIMKLSEKEWDGGSTLNGYIPWHNYSEAKKSLAELNHKGVYIWLSYEVPQYSGITANKRGYRGRFTRYIGGDFSECALPKHISMLLIT